MAERQRTLKAPPIGDLESVTLTKAQLADLLFEQIGLNKREAGELIDAFFSTMSETLVRGEAVKLPGFGNFEVKMKAARPGRNPRTGDPVPIPARRVVTFRTSQKLKKKIEDMQAGDGATALES